MRSLKSKIMAGILALSMIVSSCFTPLWGVEVAEAAGYPAYNADAAIAYASSHWNDGVGWCAEFVSRCVQAGGINIGTEITTLDCYNAIIDYTGVQGQNLALDGNGYATRALDGSILQKGDVVIQWCYTHNLRPHILICAGYDSAGVAVYYAHNSALNCGRYELNHNDDPENGHTRSCDMGAKVLHLNGKTDDGTKPVISNLKMTEVTETGYTIELDATDNVGVDRVEFPTWESYKTSDGCTWYKPTSVNGNHYTFKMSIKDFNNYQGNYNTHVYVWDAAGNYAVGAFNNTSLKRSQPVASVIVGSSKYELYDSTCRWSDAKSIAEKLGGRLATVPSEEVQGKLTALVGKGKKGAYWIGASDAASEGTFKWVTGEGLSYRHFQNGQPDDAGGNEDYIGMWASSGEWNDFPDTYYRDNSSIGFIVEYTNVHTTHNFDDGVVTKAPTCTEKGSRTLTCKDCGATKVEEIAATGHKTVIDKAKNPTYESTGLTEGSHCEICGKILVPQKEIPKLVRTPGWSDVDGGRIYVLESGERATGLKVISKNYYIFDEDGFLQTGWCDLDGKRYYAAEDGVLVHGANRITVKGVKKIFYFDKKRVMQDGFITIKDKTYYFDKDKGMLTGVQKIDGKKYYFSTKGVMQTGWLEKSGKKFYFNSDGIMVTGKMVIDGSTYYFKKNGVMTVGWLEVSGKKFFFDQNGVMQKGWKKIAGKTYRFSSKGIMKYGWTEYKGNWYYLQEDGSVLMNGSLTIGPNTYYFNEKGVCTNP